MLNVIYGVVNTVPLTRGRARSCKLPWQTSMEY